MISPRANFIRVSIYGLSLIFLFGMGCGKDVERRFLEDVGTVTDASTNLKQDQFVQPDSRYITEKVDVLFVVDTSNSLDDERGSVVSGLLDLISKLPEAADIQLAVMLAHAGDLTGKLYQADSEPFVLKSLELSETELMEGFSKKMSDPTEDVESDGGEAGLYSLSNGISSPLVEESKGMDFFREDAALVIVFVSDENDTCSRYLGGILFVDDPNEAEIPAYEKYCLDQSGFPNLTHEILFAQISDFQIELPFVLAGLIYTGENPIWAISENEVGYGYKELVELSGGLLVDLADPLPDGDLTAPDSERIALGLGDVGEFTSLELLNLENTFVLSETGINPESIEVTVDGVSVDFVFDAKGNQVELTEFGGPGSVILIRYAVLEA